jgi:hypothetical protein
VLNLAKEPTLAESSLAHDFEDHCWCDGIDADTIEIYQAYRRQTYVGDNPAVLVIEKLALKGKMA